MVPSSNLKESSFNSPQVGVSQNISLNESQSNLDAVYSPNLEQSLESIRNGRQVTFYNPDYEVISYITEKILQNDPNIFLSQTGSFTIPLLEEIQRLQQSHGLLPTGKIDKNLLAILEARPQTNDSPVLQNLPLSESVPIRNHGDAFLEIPEIQDYHADLLDPTTYWRNAYTNYQNPLYNDIYGKIV
jgi:hypothetical protein